MAKSRHEKSGSHKTAKSPGNVAEALARMRNDRYEEELRSLHIELVRLQQWVVQTGAKICVVFEGRDGAGKGGRSRLSRSA